MTASSVTPSLRKEKNTGGRSKSFILWIAILPVVFGLGLGSGYWVWGRAAAVKDPSAAQQVTRYNVLPGDNPSLGPANAPITVIEFSDYQCPYCRKWHTEVFRQLMAAYPDKVRLVYRDFPLTSIHPEAEPAAEAAYCAGEQMNYFDYQDRLFSMQYGLDKAAFQRYAAEQGLDMDRFNTCLDTGKFNSKVMANYQYAAKIGISSTPTFFINGIAIVGAQPLEVFQQVIDQELAGKLK